MQAAIKKQVIKEGLQLDHTEMNDFQKKLIESWSRNDQGFDTRVHIVDPKTGQLLKFQPYRREVHNGAVTYYRRDESGRERRFSESGNPLDEASFAADKKGK